MSFLSTFREVYTPEEMQFPEFTGLRIMMMPVRLGFWFGVPRQYRSFYKELLKSVEARHFGEIGYLTIDEQELEAGQTLRRPGLHVDGYYQGRAGAWGGGGAWGSVGNGMLTVSSTSHCRAYLGMFEGEPGSEGECGHLAPPNDGVVFKPRRVYWLDGACVHESMPVNLKVKRQFVRLSLPSNGPWFEGYTPNPTGILPSAEILPRRAFMASHV